MLLYFVISILPTPVPREIAATQNILTLYTSSYEFFTLSLFPGMHSVFAGFE
jgi:hypothetical protein